MVGKISKKVAWKTSGNSYILVIGSSVKVLGNTLSLILPCSVYLPLLFKKVACKSILQTTKHRAIKELASKVLKNKQYQISCQQIESARKTFRV